MMRFTLLTLACTGVSVLAAPVPKELRKSDKLEGQWELVSLEARGRVVTPLKQRWRIEADKITIEGNLPNAALRPRPPLAIKVDAAASPRALDYNVGPAQRPAIYEVDGDTLKILMNVTVADERPKEMKPDDKTVLYVFQRVKE